MKFKAHQTFFIRKGWLSKGIHAVEKDEKIFMPSSSKEAMDVLGLGSNQVIALRYWLTSVGLIEKSSNRKSHSLTDFGQIVLKNDPYIEEIGTLWALHCNLSSNLDEATSWYYLFNEYQGKTFDKESLAKAIQAFALVNDDNDNPDGRRKIALSSIESDFDVITNTYISHAKLSEKTVSPENVIDCPLAELGLIDVDNKKNKTFRKKQANPAALPALLIMFAICLMCNKVEKENDPSWIVSQEIPLGTLLNGKNSPGRLFNLDSVLLLSKLSELENREYLRINRTAGTDVIRLLDQAVNPLSYLQRYYKEIG